MNTERGIIGISALLVLACGGATEPPQTAAYAVKPYDLVPDRLEVRLGDHVALGNTPCWSPPPELEMADCQFAQDNEYNGPELHPCIEGDDCAEHEAKGWQVIDRELAEELLKGGCGELLEGGSGVIRTGACLTQVVLDDAAGPGLLQEWWPVDSDTVGPWPLWKVERCDPTWLMRRVRELVGPLGTSGELPVASSWVDTVQVAVVGECSGQSAHQSLWTGKLARVAQASRNRRSPQPASR